MAIRKNRKTGHWEVEFQQRGERVHRSLPKGAGEKDAKELETKLRREIFSVADLGKKPEIALGEAIEIWLRATLSQKKDQKTPPQRAVLLEPFVVGKSLRQAPQAAEEAVKAWTAKNYNRMSENLGSGSLRTATINRRLCILKATCKHAWRKGLIEENLSGRIVLLREDNKRSVYLTAEEVRKLAESAATSTASAAIMIAAYSGLRAGELLMLGATDIRKDSITVQSKNGPIRRVPIVDTIRPYLQHLPLGLSYRTLLGYFWSARAKAGMPHVRFHDLRHSTASMLINAGVPLFTVGEILGHTSTQTTKRYSHLNDQSLREAMAKIG